MGGHGDGSGSAADLAGSGSQLGSGGGAGFMGNPGAGDGSGGQFQGRHQGFGPTQRATRIFIRLDVNEDELLSLDEFLARPNDRRANRFDWLDADADGLISRDEYLDAHAMHGGDSVIDLEALHACIGEQMGDWWTSPPDRESHFDAMDTNDDGYVDPEEFDLAKTNAITERFNVIDADADSVISPEELSDALGTLRQHRGVRRDCIEEQQDINNLLGE
jgi:Ca2+-binding EF-hand superfamily protein